MKALTRRRAAIALLLPAAVPLAQTAPQAPAPEEVEAARQQLQANLTRLRSFRVPTATEPSFAFKP